MVPTALSTISGYVWFHKPGRPDLWQGSYTQFDPFRGIQRVLTDVEMLALTLNEICALQGKGLFLWNPEPLHNVMTPTTAMSFRAKPY